MSEETEPTTDVPDSEQHRPGPSRLGRDSSLTIDRLFELLADPDKRFVLDYLQTVEDETTYSTLVEYVVTNTEPPADLTEAEFRGRVAARLVHSTVPKLADNDLVEHDRDEQIVSSTSHLDSVRPYLEVAREQARATDEETAE